MTSDLTCHVSQLINMGSYIFTRDCAISDAGKAALNSLAVTDIKWYCLKKAARWFMLNGIVRDQ